MDTDSALRLLGRLSKWQVQRYIVYGIGFGIPYSWMMMSAVFIGDTPAHRCALPPNATLNETIPRVYDEDGNWEWSKCEMFSEPGVSNRTTSCTHGYWYDPESGYTSTLVTDFDLVCGHNWLFELSMSINALGSGLGSILFTRLADLYGRKPVFLWCMWSNTIVAIVMAFSPNYIFYTVFSFIDGLQQQGLLAAAVVLEMELFPTEDRTFAGTCIEFFWAFGYMVLAPIAYFLRNWRHLQLAISTPLLLTVSFYWWVSESIPWLVTNKRYKEAEELMQKAAKTNGITIPHNIFTDPSLAANNQRELDEIEAKLDNEKPSGDELTDDKEKKPVTISKEDEARLSLCAENGDVNNPADTVAKYSFVDVFKSRTLRFFTLILFFTWFVNTVTYYSLNFTVTYLPGDRYLNLFLYALMEVPAYALTWVIIYKVGRRVPLSIFHITAGVCLVLNIISYFVDAGNISGLIIAFNVIGKYGITSSYATIYVNTPEMYPTNARNLGLGMCMTISQVASYIAPYSRTLHRAYPWLPPVIIGVLSIIAGLLCLMLPETRHTKLPDTIEEVEEWQKKNK